MRAPEGPGSTRHEQPARPAPEEAARALAASETLFRIAFEQAPNGMAIVSLAPETAGQYIRANPAFCTMLGRSASELADLTIADLTHPDDRDRDWATFQCFARGEQDRGVIEKRYVHSDGHSVFATVTARVAPDENGEPLFVLIHAVDITDRRRDQDELSRLALTDPLTGLANRTLLNDRLDQAIARLHRDTSYAALFLLDIDRFKFVNESLGHEQGDALLIEVASRLEAVSRADATVARVGGDEFVVLVEGLSGPAEVHRIGVRLLEILRRPYLLKPASERVVVTASIGIAIANASDRSPGDVYREADLARYRAKDGGRDQYALFDDELRSRVAARMKSENLVRRALADDLLVPHYQPVIDLAEGRIIGVEALVRITDPVRGLVHPPEFIDVAEETGLITDIDVRMFELAVGQLATWRTEGKEQLSRLAVNVSARSLDDPHFVDRVAAALTWYDIPGRQVRIELTERSLLATSENVQKSLARISEIGLQVGLDDFGTGYSAMAYLQRFPLRFLKIDRSFVSRLGNSHRDDAVVASVISLAHAHELLVVAEGIETVEQLAALRAMGCDRGQGFLIGPGLDRPALEELVLENPRW